MKKQALTVISINDRIRPRPGYRVIDAFPSQGLFVIRYSTDGFCEKNVPQAPRCDVYFNNDGKEIFAVVYMPRFTFWKKVAALFHGLAAIYERIRTKK